MPLNPGVFLRSPFDRAAEQADPMRCMAGPTLTNVSDFRAILCRVREELVSGATVPRGSARLC